MAPNPHRQVGLSSDGVEMVAFLPDDPRVRPGNSLTLKDHEMGPDRRWNILWVGSNVVEKSSLRTSADWTKAYTSRRGSPIVPK